MRIAYPFNFSPHCLNKYLKGDEGLYSLLKHIYQERRRLEALVEQRELQDIVVFWQSHKVERLTNALLRKWQKGKEATNEF